MKRGVLIYNPTAGQRNRRAAMSALIDDMRSQGLELVNAPTEGPKHATEIVRTFLPRGLDVVAAAGGDGTISEVACGLAGSSVPLAILPAGTSNVLVRELGIPLDFRGGGPDSSSTESRGGCGCCSPTTVRFSSGPASVWTRASWATPTRRSNDGSAGRASS